MKPSLLLLSLAAAALQPAHAASDADLRRCRAITETSARLACYDALPVGAAPAAAPAAAAAPAPAPRAVTAAPAAVAAPTPAAAATTVAPAPSGVAGFGLTRARGGELSSIDSHIVGNFDGWESRTRFTLGNGQVWRVSDGSSAAYPPAVNPKVKVSRAALGSFLLEIEGAKRAPRVERVE